MPRRSRSARSPTGPAPRPIAVPVMFDLRFAVGTRCRHRPAPRRIDRAPPLMMPLVILPPIAKKPHVVPQPKRTPVVAALRRGPQPTSAAGRHRHSAARARTRRSHLLAARNAQEHSAVARPAPAREHSQRRHRTSTSGSPTGRRPRLRRQRRPSKSKAAKRGETDASSGVGDGRRAASSVAALVEEDLHWTVKRPSGTSPCPSRAARYDPAAIAPAPARSFPRQVGSRAETTPERRSATTSTIVQLPARKSI